MANCSLCLQDRQLRKSHIIPEFLYQPLYGPTHQIRSVHADLPYIRFLRKGLRHKLLCEDCEKLLGKYEIYFSSIWYGAQGLPNVILSSANKVLKSGLNYELFKLFHLSILWRASVATLDDFSGVSLDKKHEDKIREMLLFGNPGSVNDYRIGASILLRPGSREVHGGVIGVPVCQSRNEELICSAIYGGCIWHCIVSPDSPVDIDVLQDDGTLSMTVFDISEIPAISVRFERSASALKKNSKCDGK